MGNEMNSPHSNPVRAARPVAAKRVINTAPEKLSMDIARLLAQMGNNAIWDVDPRNPACALPQLVKKTMQTHSRELPQLQQNLPPVDRAARLIAWAIEIEAPELVSDLNRNLPKRVQQTLLEKVVPVDGRRVSMSGLRTEAGLRALIPDSPHVGNAASGAPRAKANPLENINRAFDRTAEHVEPIAVFDDMALAGLAIPEIRPLLDPIAAEQRAVGVHS